MTMTPDSPLAAGPAAAPQRGQMFAIYTGLITTGLTLFGVYWLNKQAPDFNIMGWYLNLVIPIGALLVGLAAGSGYGIGSAMSGLKISGRMLLLIVVLQIIAYFVAQYIEYREVVSQWSAQGVMVDIGFWDYYRLNALNMAWKKDGGGMGEPLGKWGYAVRALEIAGFAAGGLIVPAVMRARPYCDNCRRYMKTRELGVIPAAVPARKVKKSDAEAVAAYEAEQNNALEEGTTRYERLCSLATSGDATTMRSELAPLAAGKKAAQKLPRRMEMSLVSCEGCNCGRLVTKVLSGTGDKTTTELLPPVEVPPEFVREFAKA